MFLWGLRVAWRGGLECPAMLEVWTSVVGRLVSPHPAYWCRGKAPLRCGRTLPKEGNRPDLRRRPWVWGFPVFLPPAGIHRPVNGELYRN